MKQRTFTAIEYSFRKKKTKREEFLENMDEIIPWDEWVRVIEPYYPKGKRGHPPMGMEKMLWMYLLQIWFNLSDPATKGAIYDRMPRSLTRLAPQRTRIKRVTRKCTRCKKEMSGVSA